MADACTIYAPFPFFPSQDQLAPLCPDAEVKVDAEAGRALISWPSVRVTLSRMPNEKVSEHLSGFIGYARSNGGSEALATRILHTLSVFGAIVEPGFDEEGQALGFLSAFNSAGDGLCFLEGEVFDGEGRPLLMAEGSGLAPPAASRVVNRALILLAVSMRGLLEQDAGKPEQAKAEGLRRELGDWVGHSPAVLEECEEAELELLDAPLGTLDQQSVVDAVWRAEGAQVLLWALDARPLPAHDAQEHPYQVAKECGVLGETLPAALATPHLRSPEEIETQRRKLLGIHWRLRELKMRPQAADFVAFAGKNWFGGFSLDGIAIQGTDLAVGGKPISEAEPQLVELTRSIANERHQAANWLIGVHPIYSSVGTPT